MGGPDVEVEWYAGDRELLRPLFELAEDSPAQLETYLRQGRVLVARAGSAVVGHLQVVDDGHDGHVQLKNMAVRADHRRRGLGGHLVRTAFRVLAAEGATIVRVATAAADTANLHFYQRQGFRMRSIERDVFTVAGGYPSGHQIDGIALRDRVWLDVELPFPPAP